MSADADHASPKSTKECVFPSFPCHYMILIENVYCLDSFLFQCLIKVSAWRIGSHSCVCYFESSLVDNKRLLVLALVVLLLI